MSAWTEIVNANSGDEWLEMCSAALLEIQHETGRRLAEMIRTEADSPGHSCYECSCQESADLIDPEVQE